MPTPFIMPKMDMDQEVVTIIAWLKTKVIRSKKANRLLK